MNSRTIRGYNIIIAYDEDDAIARREKYFREYMIPVVCQQYNPSELQFLLLTEIEITKPTVECYVAEIIQGIII